MPREPSKWEPDELEAWYGWIQDRRPAGDPNCFRVGGCGSELELKKAAYPYRRATGTRIRAARISLITGLYGARAPAGGVTDDEVATRSPANRVRPLPLPVPDDQGICGPTLDRARFPVFAVPEDMPAAIALFDRANAPMIGIAPHEGVAISPIDCLAPAAILVQDDIVILAL